MAKYIFILKGLVKHLLFRLSKSEFREYHNFPFDYNKTPLPKKAADVMAACCGILEGLGIRYRLTDGTILGLYRQGDFIPHDDDIDIDILDYAQVECLHEMMKSFSMKLGRKVIYKQKVQQMVYYNSDKIVVDLVFWHSEGATVFNYCERGCRRSQEKRFFESMPQLEYRGRKFPMPSQIEEWLGMRYGPDWRIPKTYKGDWKAECGDIERL